MGIMRVFRMSQWLLRLDKKKKRSKSSWDFLRKYIASLSKRCLNNLIMSDLD